MGPSRASVGGEEGALAASVMALGAAELAGAVGATSARMHRARSAVGHCVWNNACVAAVVGIAVVLPPPPCQTDSLAAALGRAVTAVRLDDVEALLRLRADPALAAVDAKALPKVLRAQACGGGRVFVWRMGRAPALLVMVGQRVTEAGGGGAKGRDTRGTRRRAAGG